MKNRNLFKIIIIFLFIIIIVFLIGYFYFKINKFKNQTNIDNAKEIKQLISKINQIYLSPEGEIPTVATVTDPEVLKEKLFFTLAQKGDKVFIYSHFGKAVLYRPSINKIVEIVSVKTSINDNKLD